MAPPAAASAPLPRAFSRGRAAADPGCAGCAQLGLFRALRRAGLDVQGQSGCEPDADRPFIAAAGRWAAVAGARRLLAGGQGAVAEAAAAGARLFVLVDREGADGRRAAALLAATGARVVPLDGLDLAGAEAAAREASVAGGALVVLSPCARRSRPGPPLAIAASRCNRCGACLSLGCPAISDEGGDALVVDPSVCTGCGLCAPLCRARAIGR